MLLILYGTTSELGRICRDYLGSKGFHYIAKYAYAEEEPILKARHGGREFLDRDTFLAKTDAMFRYHISNFQVGFNWNQISEAVYGDEDSLLTYSMSDMQSLRKIKEIFGDRVRLVYCYVDSTALEGQFVVQSDMTQLEYGERMAIGMSVKKSYCENADIFDAVVIYAGEGSLFNYASLYKQFDALLSGPHMEKEASSDKYDVTVFFGSRNIEKTQGNSQYCFFMEISKAMSDQGIRVRQIEGESDGQDLEDPVREAVFCSRVLVPILTEASLQDERVRSELEIAIETAKNRGAVILPIALDCLLDLDGLAGSKAYPVSSENYAGAICFVEDWISSMFSGEAELKKLSEEVEISIASSLYKKAYILQDRYITLLQNHLAKWRQEGSREKINAFVKLLYLAVKTENNVAGSEIADKLLSAMTEELGEAHWGKVVDALAEYGILANYVWEVFAEKIQRLVRLPEAAKQRFTQMLEQRYLSYSGPTDTAQANPATIELVDKIAAYSDATIGLFETLFEHGIAPGYQDALIAAYHRIIDYCRSVNLGNEITEKCVDRVFALQASESKTVEETDAGQRTLKSLKVYLGQALPDTGTYDVFLSHNSADDELANRVYNYLTERGYVVFCDHQTLGELRDSNYDKRVTEALQNSKHMILIASDTAYVKNQWVYYEWHLFFSEKRENRRNGNLIMILPDNLLQKKGDLPSELRDGIEIIKTSEFRNRLLDYLW